MLPATEALLDLRRRLLQIRAEKARRMAEVADLQLEEERLETAIKLAIGTTNGIDRVATWRTVDGRRRFDPEWLKADDPQLCEAYLSYVPKFESAKFKAEDPRAMPATRQFLGFVAFISWEIPTRCDGIPVGSLSIECPSSPAEDGISQAHSGCTGPCTSATAMPLPGQRRAIGCLSSAPAAPPHRGAVALWPGRGIA
jgi:hypothetical protein